MSYLKYNIFLRWGLQLIPDGTGTDDDLLSDDDAATNDDIDDLFDPEELVEELAQSEVDALYDNTAQENAEIYTGEQAFAQSEVDALFDMSENAIKNIYTASDKITENEINNQFT